ncbi:MAG: single-stranded-DNA-specific exonuclease RecJ [Oscillospiraceae bacterium]|jgi:single-stranded-DNA-specific exonuclease|nr:single-stranded-DNA-specific exonuclease RecJ [Oscillospiraceae bacterium]
MKYENWDIIGFNREKAVDFLQNKINPLVSVFLASRGFSDIEEANSFIDKNSVVFYDPFLLTDMDKAVKVIKKAVKNKERIVIHGDYDVDGMTASVVLAKWLESQGADYDVHIPKRSVGVFGLSHDIIKEFDEKNYKLIITVDCGITAKDEALYARELGIKLVITDHHECRDELPMADAVINPKRPDCTYPYKYLAGVGVAFKLACALEGDYLSDKIINKYIDYVAVGTVADVMLLTGENRDLVKRGIDKINNDPEPCFRYILSSTNSEITKVTSSTIGYVIAPRINAAGRMNQPKLSVDLMLTNDEEEAKVLAEKLDELNIERRNIETEIYDDAIMILGEDIPDSPIVISSKKWDQGVTGIVATKIAERYRLPTVIISIDKNGTGRGSCRSYGSYSIYDALYLCKDLFDDFGGHDKAAGITIPEKNIDKLREQLSAIYKKKSGEIHTETLEIDFEIEKPNELLSIKNIKELELLEPFGRGNQFPKAYIHRAKLISLQSIGNGKHSKLKIEKLYKNKQGKEEPFVMECVFFFAPTSELGVKEGDYIDVAFEPQINDFRGQSNIQLQLLDLRLSKG